MGNLNSVCTVTISSSSRTPSQVGFGTPLIAGYHTRYVDRVREYSSLDALVADGFSTTVNTVGYAIYKAVQVAFSQNPAPSKVKVGRRANAPAQVIDLTVTDNTTGLLYEVTVGGFAVTYTVTTGQSLAQIATAIQGLLTTALGALATVTTTGSPASTVHIVTTTPGVLLDVTGRSAHLTLRNATADPGLAADLAAINAADSDWYGLALDSNSAAEITVAAAWVASTAFKFGCFDTADTACGDSGSTADILYTEHALTHGKSAIVYNDAALQSCSGIALLAEELPWDPPGKRTWEYKTLRGVPFGTPSETQQSAITTKCGVYYIELAAIGVTRNAKASSGEWIDINVGTDWFIARLQEAVYGLFVNNGKVPYTPQGLALVESVIRGMLLSASSADGKSLLAQNTAETPQNVVMPIWANILPADKAARRLTGVSFSAYYSGAIHSAQLVGTFTV